MTTATLKRARREETAVAGNELIAVNVVIDGTVKRARMELKTTDAAKELLSLAAAAEGMDLTSFVLGPAMEKARRVLSEHATINLTREGQLTLASLFNSVEEPTKAMRDLMSLPDLPRA